MLQIFKKFRSYSKRLTNHNMSIGKSIVIINIFLIERLVTISTRNLFTDTNLNIEFTKNTIKHIENTEIGKKYTISKEKQFSLYIEVA